MPIRSESYSSPPTTLKVGWRSTRGSGGTYRRSIPSRMSKSQTGYRSGPLSKEERSALDSVTSRSWASSLKTVSSLEDEYEYNTRASRSFMVNDRDFLKTELIPARFQGDVFFEGVAENYHYWGALVPQVVNSGWLPPSPGSTTIQSIAGSLLRQSVPTQAEINLTRFVGELKDAPEMFRARAYRPRNPKEVAGAYLNYLFGVKPTVSDLQKISETVIHMDDILRRYLRQERIRVRRTASRVLDSNSGYGSVPRMCDADYPFTMGPVRGVGHYVSPGAQSGYLAGVQMEGSWSWSSSREIRTFASFEYFIPRPKDIESRLSRYHQLAQRVVGGGLDAPTAYDLTPWTWLVDWFVDIGGLLHYQQNVVDNQVVTSRCGYSLFETLTWECSLRRWYFDDRGNSSMSRTRYQDVSPSHAFVSVFKQTRRKGSPYSISPTWTLSSQQWAILAALGLARSRDVRV